MYRPRNRKGSAVRKGGEGGREEAETNVPERNEKREGKEGGGKKEARRVIARDCTVARIIARAPEKRHFKFVHPPPEKRTFSSLLLAPVPIQSTEYPRYPSFERRFFETPAVLSPRIIFRPGREIELLPPRGFQIRNYGNYGNVAEDEIF